MYVCVYVCIYICIYVIKLGVKDDECMIVQIFFFQHYNVICFVCGIITDLECIKWDFPWFSLLHVVKRDVLRKSRTFRNIPENKYIKIISINTIYRSDHKKCRNKICVNKLAEQTKRNKKYVGNYNISEQP